MQGEGDIWPASLPLCSFQDGLAIFLNVAANNDGSAKLAEIECCQAMSETGAKVVSASDLHVHFTITQPNAYFARYSINDIVQLHLNVVP